MNTFQTLLYRLSIRVSQKLPQHVRLKHTDPIKSCDEKMYGDWKSLDYMFAEADPRRTQLIGRWDWHVWQTLIALIPAGCIYGIAQYANADIEKNRLRSKIEGQRESEAQEANRATDAETATRADDFDARIRELERKLEETRQLLVEKSGTISDPKSAQQQAPKSTKADAC